MILRGPAPGTPAPGTRKSQPRLEITLKSSPARCILPTENCPLILQPLSLLFYPQPADVPHVSSTYAPDILPVDGCSKGARGDYGDILSLGRLSRESVERRLLLVQRR